MGKGKAVPNSEGTQFRAGDEQAEIARKGGVASGEARRKKKAIREAASVFASLKAPADVAMKLAAFGVDAEDCDMQMAIIAKMFREGMKGNTKAAKIVIDLLAEDTTEKTGITREDMENVSSFIREAISHDTK